MHEPNISPWRRAICGDLTSAFDFGLENTKPAALPATDGFQPPDNERHDSYVPKPPANPVLPKQEPGSRPSRPLPYAPFVDGAGTPSTGRYTLTFSGGDKAGACFTVTGGNRTDGPWTYTTEAGKKIADTWNTSYSKDVYDLSVYGPNGFLRSFKGDGKKAGPEVTARHDATAGRLVLTLTNHGSTDCHLTVTNAYGGASETYPVRAGATVKKPLDLRASKRWYDLSVTSDTDKSFLRRFAGHVENGETGVSDPAIITG